MRACSRLAPGQGVQAPTHRRRHQLVPGGMERHLIDAVAIAIMGVQRRRILVRREAPADSLRRSRAPPNFAQPCRRPARALTRHAFAQWRIRREEIVIHQRRRLVQHLVRGLDGDIGLFNDGHGKPPPVFSRCWGRREGAMMECYVIAGTYAARPPGDQPPGSIKQTLAGGVRRHGYRCIIAPIQQVHRILYSISSRKSGLLAMPLVFCV
jgi:hypothetical protein